MLESNFLTSYLDQGTYIHASTIIEEGVFIGQNVSAVEPGIRILARARIEAGSTIHGDVTIHQDSVVKAGSVITSSVPANAIVQGNPAYVVGFQSCSQEKLIDGQKRSTARLVTYDDLPRGSSATSNLFLGVGGSIVYTLSRFHDSRGSLVVGETPTSLPFQPKRLFYIFDVPGHSIRGEHAHKKCEQFLICLRGSCRALVDDGVHRCEVLLDRPNLGLYVPAMLWGTQYKYSDDAILLVLASMEYSTQDYIRDYADFCKSAT